MNLRLSILTLLVASATFAAEPDIIEHAAAHPRGVERVQQPDGSYKESKYGDHKLAEAEAFLTPSHPRPWTVTQALEWFHATDDDRVRVHILRLLSASRDPRAALILGAASDSESLNIRVAACYGLLDYFVPMPVVGGTEQHMQATHEWFTSNKARLQKEAATK